MTSSTSRQTHTRTHLRLVVRPAAELERADLLVEREVGDVDLAAADETRRRRPEHRAVARHHRVTRHVARREVVSTATYDAMTQQLTSNVATQYAAHINE